jgi:hypothetical protein
MAPYICAKLREMSHVAMLKDNSEFHAFCLKRWRQKSLLDDLLCQRKTPQQLKDMSSVEKQKAVYQCSLEEEYADTVAARSSRTEWLSLVALDDFKDVPLPSTWFQCVRYFKSSLVVNEIYSLPSDLFDAALNFDAGAFDYAAFPDPVADGLASVVLPTSLLDLEDLRQHTLFQVVNLAPEARTTMKVNHMRSSRVFITINVLDILVTQSSRRRVITKGDRDVLKTLDVRGLVCNMGATIQGLFRWSVAAQRSTVRAIDQGSGGSRHGAFSSDRYPWPAAIGETAGVPSVPAAPCQTLALARSSETDSAETLALFQLWRQDAVVGREGGSVLFQDLIGVHSETLHALVASNAVQLHHNEFGEVMVAANPAGLAFSASLILEEPVQHVRTIDASDPLRCAKVSLLFVLHQSGWRSSALLYGGHARGDLLYYKEGLQQPLSYFASLVLRDSIFAKGAPCIYHGQLDAYYRCLLNLSRAALANLLPIMRDQNAAFFKTHLVLEDGNADEPREPGDGGLEDEPGIVAVLDVPLQLCAALVAPVIETSMWKRCVCDLGEGTLQLKVYFDGCSHQSGKQRGWIDCSTHSCIKYVPVFADMATFCTALYIWERHGESADCLDRFDHLAYWPSDSDVELAKPRLRMMPF